MAKVVVDWSKSKALFEAGKSYREIDEITGINYKAVERASKKGGWERGKLSQLISDKTRVEAEFVTLESAQAEVVTTEVAERLKHIEFFTKAGLKVASMAVKSMGNDPKPIDCKIVADTLVSTMKVSGVVPYYPTSAVINNTNAQQNNEPMKIIIERDNG
jgi:hypothetical protein